MENYLEFDEEYWEALENPIYEILNVVIEGDNMFPIIRCRLNDAITGVKDWKESYNFNPWLKSLVNSERIQYNYKIYNLIYFGDYLDYGFEDKFCLWEDVIKKAGLRNSNDSDFIDWQYYGHSLPKYEFEVVHPCHTGYYIHYVAMETALARNFREYPPSMREDEAWRYFYLGKSLKECSKLTPSQVFRFTDKYLKNKNVTIKLRYKDYATSK